MFSWVFGVFARFRLKCHGNTVFSKNAKKLYFWAFLGVFGRFSVFSDFLYFFVFLGVFGCFRVFAVFLYFSVFFVIFG